jgi:hypothetical protein
MGAHSNRYRFFTNILVHASWHGSIHEEPEEFFLEPPDAHHLLVEQKGLVFFHNIMSHLSRIPKLDSDFALLIEV